MMAWQALTEDHAGDDRDRLHARVATPHLNVDTVCT